MKTIYIKIIVISFLIVIATTCNLIFNNIEKNLNKPILIKFELPLPDEICNKYNIEKNPDIEKVIVAGFFSDWSPNDSNYELTRTSSNTWEILLNLNPGKNQYKFVVYLKDKNQIIWVHDKNAKYQVDDKFGGYNSVVIIKSIKNIQFIFNFIIFGLIVILVLFSLLNPIIQYIMKLKIGFNIKLVIITLFTAILSNTVFIFYNYFETRNIIKEVFIDSINLIHNFLKSENIEFNNLNDIKTKEKLNSSLKKFFWNARARIEKNKHSNIQISISDILIFDTNFNIIAISSRNEVMALHSNDIIKYNFNNIEEYFKTAIFGKSINEIKKVISKNIYNTRISDWFSISDKKYLKYASKIYKCNLFYLGYNRMLYPIVEKGNICGYYGLSIQTELFGNELRRILVFNFYILCVLCILLSLLSFNISNVLVKHIKNLLEWTENIIQGNFSVEKKIKTNDEIEKLANNFNMMRISLKESFDKAQQKYSELKEIVDLKNELINNFLSFMNITIYNLSEYSNELSKLASTNKSFLSIYNYIYLIKKTIKNIEYTVNFPQDINLTEIPLYPFFTKIQKEFLDKELKFFIKDKQINLNNLIIKKLSQLDFFIKTDENLFYKLVTEILDNSIQFNKNNGTILLDITKDEKHITIIIEDTGIGITNENLEKIFLPFFREYTTIPGIGLGITVAKTICDKLGYKLTINSIKNQGTKVIIEIPIY